jgi:hypothetical protein
MSFLNHWHYAGKVKDYAMIRKPGDLPKMLTSSCDAGSGGDDGKVPTTKVFVVGTL